MGTALLLLLLLRLWSSATQLPRMLQDEILQKRWFGAASHLSCRLLMQDECTKTLTTSCADHGVPYSAQCKKTLF